MRDRLRSLLPAFLAVAFPGLGHVFLRRWGRAVVWHATIVGGAAALYILYDAGPVDPLPTPVEFVDAFPPEVSVPVSFLVGLSAIDAYLVGKEAAADERRVAAMTAARERSNGERMTDERMTDERSNGELASAEGDVLPAEEPATDLNCPTCGRETDPEIEFCHWCTEPLPWAVEGE